MVLSGLGFEGWIGVDWTDRRAIGGTVCAQAWYLGNCSQVGIVEPKLCMCMCVVCVYVPTRPYVPGGVYECRRKVGDAAREEHKCWIVKGIAPTNGWEQIVFSSLIPYSTDFY